MKYLIVTADLVKTGGMDRANYALANYIKCQGQELHLVAHRVDPDLLNGDHVIWHPVVKPLNSYFLGEPLLDLAGRSLAYKITVEGGKVLVNGGNCQWGGVNWVHYVHAAYESNNFTNIIYKLKAKIAHQLFTNAESQSLKLAKVIITNSEKTKQDLITNLNIPTAKIKTIYYGCDPIELYPPTIQQKLYFRQELGWAETKLVVVFIGGLGDRRKGFDTLFSAWQQLCADPYWDVDLKVIGRGSELDTWKLKAQIMGDRIEFLGFRQDVPNILRAADCLVAPTRYEAYGLGVQEAICCGLPAIVSANAGIAEKYPSNLQELLLDDPNDPQTLINALLSWRRNIPKYSELVKPFTETLRSYTWDNMAEQIVEHFKY